MRKTLAAVMLCAGLQGSAWTTDFSKGGIGTSGSDFLTFDIGARCIALGGACTAVSDDAYALYWNPAGLSKVPRVSAAASFTRYVQDVTYQSIEGAARVADLGVVGAGARYRDVGSISQTDVSGNSLGTFHPRDYIAETGWGESIYDLSDSEVDVAMGVAGRWIHSEIVERADGFSGDLGVMSRFYQGSWLYDFGIVAQNMGVGQKFDQVRDTLPFRLKAGGAIYPVKNLVLTLDALLPVNNVAHGALGGEYVIEASRQLKLALRAGLNSLTYQSLGVASMLSGGVGVTAGDFSFDYAFAPMGILGQTHRFSISYNLPAKTSSRYRER